MFATTKENRAASQALSEGGKPVADRIPASIFLVPRLPQAIRQRLSSNLSYTCQPEADLFNPRLVAISGSLEGTVRAVKDGVLSLGRDPSNQVVVGEPAASRKHCTISEVSAGIFEIADHDSRNGTFLNGVRVSRTPLRHGDKVRIGINEFVFLTGPDDDAALPSSTVGTIFLDQRSGLPSAGVGRMARDLSAFFKIANVINSTHDMEAMQRQLLMLICEVVPAAQGAIVLQRNMNEEPSPACTWSRDGDANQDLAIREEWA